MVILDTCTLLWVVSGHSQLSSKAKELIAHNAGALYVSSISALEVGIKHRRKKLRLPLPPEEWFDLALALHGIFEIPVSWRVAVRASTLPMHHNDPFDRLIIATAQLTEAILLTPDQIIPKYRGLRVIW